MGKSVSRVSPPVDFLKKIFISQNNYLILISAFLLGSSNIAAGTLPFGVAFFAATYGSYGIWVLTALAVLAGTTLGGSPEALYINAAGMLAFALLKIPLKVRQAGDKPDIKNASLVFLAMFLPQFMLAGFRGFLLYDVLRAVFSSFISFVLYFIFRYSVPIMAGEVKKAILAGEEAISVAVTAALVGSGISTVQVLGVSVRNTVCVALLLILSYKCGAGTGAAAGCAIGLITSISPGATPAITGSYALCGMLSGMLRNLGRVGSALGFIMGSMILSAYLNGAIEVNLYLREILIGTAIFFVLPRKFIDMLTNPFARDFVLPPGRISYSRRMRDITVQKLRRFARAFGEMAKTFQEISETRTPTDRQDINVLFDRVADRICSDCSSCLHCWERNFYDTYQVMFKIVEKLEAKGRVEESDIPGYFLDRCARISDFVNAVNNMYELFKVGVIWKSKLDESLSVISRQFEGMSGVISTLAGEIDTEVNFLTPLEEQISAALHHMGIKVREVIVYKNNWGKYEANVLHNACGGARVCISAIEKAVSDAVGKKMTRVNEDCVKERDGSCSIKLIEAENLRITTGIARIPKYGSEVSGDSFTFMNGENGKHTMALSDGMGTGYSAAAQSRAVINMLESFFESGFDKEMAVSLVNSALMLKSNEDLSCTIDISIIDLFNGEVEFVKIGAAPTYIKRADTVEIIRAATLPAGILPGIDAELARRRVEAGDMIIMVTDGIIDSFSGDLPGEKSLLKFIQKMDCLNPQKIADSILEEADRYCGNKPCDDMTVLVAKVWKKV